MLRLPTPPRTFLNQITADGASVRDLEGPHSSEVEDFGDARQKPNRKEARAHVVHLLLRHKRVVKQIDRHACVCRRQCVPCVRKGVKGGGLGRGGGIDERL